MNALLSWLTAALLLVCAWSVLHLLLASKWLRSIPAPAVDSVDLPPLTLLRPIKKGVPALGEKLAALAAAMRPGDQLVLSADDGADEEIAACETVRANFPEREIALVRCRPGVALNPKISKLVQMEKHARHEHQILSDSETMIDAAWLDAFRREWLASGADALTAGYRFAGFATCPQRLDAAAVLISLWPGLAFVRRFGRVRFTLGACTGLRRSDLAAVGGWAAFGDFLAEDNRLGTTLAQAGRTIRLSTHIATIASDPMTWRDYWRHQRRVAVTYRVCQPAGFAGMIFTHGVAASLALAALAIASTPQRPLLIGVASACLLARWVLLLRLSKILRFPVPALFPAMLAAGIVETACWIAAWLSRRVWWSARPWRVARDGRLTPATADQSSAASSRSIS